MQGFLARIVPAPGEQGTLQRTQGTSVYVGDVKLDGVTGITLRADVDDVWRATIECMVLPPAELIAAASLEVRGESWLRRIWRQIRGRHRDVTALQHYSRVFRR